MCADSMKALVWVVGSKHPLKNARHLFDLHLSRAVFGMVRTTSAATRRKESQGRRGHEDKDVGRWAYRKAGWAAGQRGSPNRLGSSAIVGEHRARLDSGRPRPLVCLVISAIAMRVAGISGGRVQPFDVGHTAASGPACSSALSRAR